MIRSAGPERMRHLEQVMANDGHVPHGEAASDGHAPDVDADIVRRATSAERQRLLALRADGRPLRAIHAALTAEGASLSLDALHWIVREAPT